MKMRFPRRRAKAAGDQAAGTPPEDQADWSGPRALWDRACCCPARPVVLVRIPPADGRPYSADLLLCGHHYQASLGGIAAANAMIITDRRSGRTGVHEPPPGDPAPAGGTLRR